MEQQHNFASNSHSQTSNLSANLVRQKNMLILCQQILTPAPKLLNLPIKGCGSSTTAIGVEPVDMIGPVVEKEIFPRFNLVDNIEYYKNLQDRDWM